MRKIAFLALALLPMVALAQNETPQSTENVAAVVNGYVITRDFLDAMADLNRILPAIKDLDEKFYDVMVNTEEGLRFLLRYKMEVLEDLVNQLLIVQLAEKEGVAPKKEEIESYVESEMEKALKDLKINMRDFEEFLRRTGTSLEAFKEKLSWVYMTKRALDNLKEKVTSGATVTEDEAKRFYEENPDVFKMPDGVKLSMIVLDSEEKAKKALDAIANGEEFSKVASEMSIDESGRNGGEIGWIFKGTEDASSLLDGYQDRVFMASVGAILGPYEIGGRWYIFRIDDKKPSTEIPFDKVKDLIIQKLLEKKKNDLWMKWFKENMEKFKEESEIEIYFGKR